MVNTVSSVPALPLEGELLRAGTKKSRHTSLAAKNAKNAQVTDAQWRMLIGLVSDGVGTLVAIKQSGARKFALEGMLRTDEKKKAEWEDAKTAALWRNWDLDTLEDILAHVAAGGTVKAAIKKYALETGASAETAFYKLILRDNTMKQMYDEARNVQAEKMAIDDVLEIADNDKEDLTDEGRPNSAAVNRSRLKVDSRKWIAGRLSFKRFGDHKHIEIDANIVVDHAARLEEARRRKEELFKKRKLKPGEKT